MTHGDETYSIFGIVGTGLLGNRPQDLETADRFMTYIINFVSNLDPNKGKAVKTVWRRYDLASENLVILNNQTSAQPDDYRSSSIEYQINLGLAVSDAY